MPQRTTPHPYELARLAGVASPDSPTSPGARWLELVASSVPELDDAADTLGELADSLVPIYTHERMSVLVDLAAYGEDLEDLGHVPGASIVDLAGIALYVVAERLLTELADLHDERATDR